MEASADLPRGPAMAPGLADVHNAEVSNGQIFGPGSLGNSLRAGTKRRLLPATRPSCPSLLSITQIRQVLRTQNPPPWQATPVSQNTSLTSMRFHPSHRATPADCHCRKKYLKMRFKFKSCLRDNNHLYEDEQHSERIAKRLQEENE